MADTLRTAAVSAVLWEERRVRDFYRATMEEIAAAAMRIAARLEALNERSGLASGIGR